MAVKYNREYPFAEVYKKNYSEGKLSSPSDFYDEGAEFFLEWAKWAYGLYCAGQTVVNNGGRLNSGRFIEELRSYGRGRQDVGKYRSMLDKEIKTPTSSGSLVNISWDNTRIYETVRAKVLDRIMERRHQPQIVAIDRAARYEKERQYFSDKLAADPRSRQLFAQTGMVPDSVSKESLMMDGQDIETLKNLGGYQYALELIMRDAVMATLDLSDYEDKVRRPMAEDIIDLSVAACHVKTLPDGTQSVKYIDPARLVCRISQHNDHSDIDFAGYVEGKTLAQVRMESGLPEEKMLELAKSYVGVANNKSYWNYNSADDWSSGAREGYSSTSRNRPYDRFDVYTMTLYFVACEAERYVNGIHPRGGLIFDKVKPDSQLQPNAKRAGKVMVDQAVQYVYKCTWVVGTDIIYDFGKDCTIVRDGQPGMKQARLPILIYGTGQSSLTERVIPVIDDMEIAIKKKRIALAKMPPPPNATLDMSLVEDGVEMGGHKFSMMDILDVYSITGWMFLNSRSEFGLPGEGSNRPPVNPIANSFIEHINMARQEVMDAISLMQQMCGLNQVTDGTGSATDVLNGVASQYEMTTNRALTAEYQADTVLLKRIASTIVKKYQLSVLYGEIEINHIPVRDFTPQVISISREISLHDFDIVVRRAPGNEAIQALVQALQSNRQNQTIGEDGYFVVLNMVLNGDIQKAQFFLSKYVAMQKRAQEQSALAMVQQQSQAQAEAAQVMEQSKLNTQMATLEAKARIQQMIEEGLDKRLAADQLHEVNMKTMDAQLGIVTNNLKQ
jgi:hypothetical protein